MIKEGCQMMMCIKTLSGYLDNFTYFQINTKPFNFQIEEGKMYNIRDDEYYIDIYYVNQHDTDLLCFFQQESEFKLEDYFITLAEWRDKQINSILDE